MIIAIIGILLGMFLQFKFNFFLRFYSRVRLGLVTRYCKSDKEVSNFFKSILAHKDKWEVTKKNVVNTYFKSDYYDLSFAIWTSNKYFAWLSVCKTLKGTILWEGKMPDSYTLLRMAIWINKLKSDRHSELNRVANERLKGLTAHIKLK